MSKSNETKRKIFITLYKSGENSLFEISDKLEVCRTTLYNWKHKYFPGDKWNKRHENQFLKHYRSGIKRTKDLAILTNMHPVSINRFKRKYKEYNSRKFQANLFRNSILRQDLIVKVNKRAN